MTDDLRVLGETVREAVDRLDVFDAPPNVKHVRFVTEELAAICPVTSQPDIYTAEIEYCVSNLCIESKSLKLYLWSFRDRGAFGEAIAAEIAQKVADAVDDRADVALTQNVRGGIVTHVHATAYPQEAP